MNEDKIRLGAGFMVYLTGWGCIVIFLWESLSTTPMRPGVMWVLPFSAIAYLTLGGKVILLKGRLPE